MACLSVTVLGPLNATLDGQPVISFEYNKLKGLFAYLVVEADRPHRREALAGYFWPDQSQKAAVDSLRNALAKLRLAIGDRNADPPFLFTTNDAIQFNDASDHKLDLTHFSQLVDTTRGHRHRRIESCAGCSDRLKIAASLYHGEFLEGFSLPDCDLFEDWVRINREKYLGLTLDALHQLASIYEWRGDFEQSLSFTRKQLELDPCRESAHLRAIRLLACEGLRAEALEQYERCREHLASELGVEPSQETTHLYEQVKYGTFQNSSTRRKSIDNLPPNLTSFVGRERELAEIAALIDDPNCRLLTLVGPGGVGKTRLAIAAAREQQETFPDGVCFVSLVGVNSPDYIVQTMLKALELTASPQGNLIAQLIGYLQDKELMLVLDNFEHLLEGAGILTEILEKAPQVIVMITSRQRLSMQAEWLFEVNGLCYPDSLSKENLDSYDAVQLFIQRLHQANPQIKLYQEDLYNLNHICHLVEGLPLGIELAVSAIHMHSILHVAKALESGKEELEVSLRDVPERHRSLRAVFNQSWNLLNEQERRTFPCLAVFRGGFTTEDAQEVAGSSQQILSSLVEHSMLRYNRQLERFDLHELVRQYALDKLKKQGRETLLHQAHLFYYMNRAEIISPKLYGPEQSAWLKCLDDDIENLRAALLWGLENDPLTGMRLASAMFLYWTRRSLKFEGTEWLKKYLDKAETKQPTKYRARAIGFLISLGLNVINSIEEWAAESLAICDIVQDDQAKAFTLYILGTAYHRRLENYKLARYYLTQGLNTFRVISDPWGEATTLIELANLAMLEKGDAISQRDNIQQALELFRQIGDIHGIAAASDNLAGVIIDIELDLNQGRRLVEDALKIYQQLNARYTSHNALWNYTKILSWQGDYQRAWDVMYERDEIMQESRDQFRILQADLLTASLDRLIGRDREAYPIIKRILKLCEMPEFKDLYGSLTKYVIRELSYLLARRGDTALAKSYLQKAQKMDPEPEELSLLLHCSGSIELQVNNGACALREFQESLKICKRSYLCLIAILDMEGIAGSFYLIGKLTESVQLLSALNALRGRIGAKVFPCDQPAQAQLIENLKRELDMEEFSSIWETGMKMNFDEAVSLALSVHQSIRKISVENFEG